MTDERVDALIRSRNVASRPDPAFSPDPAFVERSYAVLLPQVRRARQRDRRPWSRFLAALQRAPAQGQLAHGVRRTMTLAVLLMLILALLAGIAVVGALRQTDFGGNGLLTVSQGGALQTIDAETSVVRTVIKGDSPLIGLSRSPDGRLVSFWTGGRTGEQLEVANLDGSGRRELAADMNLARRGCIDVWAVDSRWLAAEVTLDGTPLLLVVNVKTGAATTVTPVEGLAECPLWSPDGRWLAFAHVGVGAPRSLAIIQPDGTGEREVSGELGGLGVSGPNSWSADGRWIYFDAQGGSVGHVYRADVATGRSEQLTPDDLHAYAPALSPDGRRVAFTDGTDLYVMGAEGANSRKVLDRALNNGWSTDGRYILAEWHPATDTANWGLMAVPVDGGEPRTLLRFEPDCLGRASTSCLDGVGWGQPRP